MVAEKKCSECGEIKTLGEFGKNVRGTDGLQGQCRKCRGIAQKAYYAANREARLAYARQYAEENKDAIKASRTEYMDTHREEAAERTRQWREDHPGYNKEYYDAHRAQIDAHRNAHPEIYKAAQDRYREAHREEIRERGTGGATRRTQRCRRKRRGCDGHDAGVRKYMDLTRARFGNTGARPVPIAEAQRT